MGNYRKVLLVAESTREATPAFRRAVHLARVTRAELHVVAFCNDPMIDALAGLNRHLMERTRRAFLDEQRASLHALIDPLAAEGLTVHLNLPTEPPFADALLEQIVALQPDLVVKDVQPEPLLRRILLGGVDWQLVNHSPVPVLFVNQHASQLPSRVIAAVDTSYGAAGLNDRIVRAALALASQCRAGAQLVHVSNYRAPVTDATLLGDSAAAYRELLQIDREQFAALADRYGVPPERRWLLGGPVPHALADFARDPLGDVLVIGAAYRGRVERLLLGRNAQSILQRAGCDVLVVKPQLEAGGSAHAVAGSLEAPAANDRAEPASAAVCSS